MKKLNRFMAIILSFTLALSCFSGTAFAATAASETVSDGENGDYAISSLYVVGSSANGAYEWLNGAGNYTLSESNLMNDYGNGYYKIDFFDVPAGNDYEFRIAAPTSNGTYEFGGFNNTGYDSGDPYRNEISYSLDLYGNSIFLDIDAKANVSITVDTTSYDPYYGTGLTASVYIEYTEQRYVLQCCDELNNQYGLTSQPFPYLTMTKSGDHYEYTFDNLPNSSQMLWCYILKIDNSGIINPDSSGNESMILFRVDPNNYYNYANPSATIYYYPETQTADISGDGIITPNSSGFSSLTLETNGNSWSTNGNYTTSYQMMQHNFDYDNSSFYEITLFDLEPNQNIGPIYSGDDYYEFYFKSDSVYNNILACDQNSVYEFSNTGLEPTSGCSQLVSSYDLYDPEIRLPRFKLTTKSDVKITVSVYDDYSGNGNNISMTVDIMPKAPVCFVSGTKNLTETGWSSTPTESNTMSYISGMYTYHSRYLENVGDIYEFFIIQRYNDEITWRGYNSVSYTDYSYNFEYNYETGSYDYSGFPQAIYGLHPYRFELTEPGYVEIHMDESGGNVSIYGNGIKLLAPYEFTNLSVQAGRISDDPNGQIEGIYPDSAYEFNPMEINGNNYSVTFKNVPAGKNYCFSILADPTSYYIPDYSADYDPESGKSVFWQFELGADQWEDYPTGASECIYPAEPGSRMMQFNLDINADVEIIFDSTYYDTETGKGGSIILKITPIKGDVNGDGITDITDATDIQFFLAMLDDFTPAQQKNADVDNDGQMSIKDVTKIQKYLAGMIESL